MKKTYISPELLVVQMRMSSAILVGSGPDAGINVGREIDEFDVKENVVTDVNVWDNEW